MNRITGAGLPIRAGIQDDSAGRSEPLAGASGLGVQGSSRGYCARPALTGGGSALSGDRAEVVLVVAGSKSVVGGVRGCICVFLVSAFRIKLPSLAPSQSLQRARNDRPSKPGQRQSPLRGRISRRRWSEWVGPLPSMLPLSWRSGLR